MTTAELKAEGFNARTQQGINAPARPEVEEDRESREFNGRLELAREITFRLTGSLNKEDVGWVMSRLFGAGETNGVSS